MSFGWVQISASDSFSCLLDLWRAVIIGPHHSISNSVRPWGFPLSWMPMWACPWTSFSSSYSPFLFLKFFSEMNNYGSEFLTVDGNPSPYLMPCLSAGSGLYNFPLPNVGYYSKVPPFDFWESLTSQVSRTFWSVPLPPTSKVACFHSLCWLAGLQSCSPHLILDLVSLFPSLSPSPTRSLPPFPLIAFFSLPSGIEASSFGPFSC